MFFIILIISSLFQIVLLEQFDVEILPEGRSCDCRDYYGGCRGKSEKWVDEDGVWKYECGENGGEARFLGCEEVEVGKNVTIDGLWHSCAEDEIKLKYSIEPHCDVNGEKRRVGEEYREGTFQWLCLSTGRWITGCYFNNETHSDILLPVGQSSFNGLIEHVCSKRQEYPAIVQYYTQVRKDVDVKHPTNKGINKNFPEPLQKLIDEQDNVRWLYKSANYFIKNDEKPLEYIRWNISDLPKSRKPL